MNALHLRTRELAQFVGLNSSASTASLATASLPIGPRYHKLELQAVATSTGQLAAISEILGTLKLKVNGRVQRNVSATHLNAYHTLLGSEFGYRTGGKDKTTGATALAAALSQVWPDTNGEYVALRLPIFFAEPWRKDYAAQRGLAFPTLWPKGERIASLQLEVEIPGTSGVTVSDLKLISTYDAGLGTYEDDGSPRVRLVKMYTNTFVHGTGDLTIDTLPAGNNVGFLQHMTLIPSNAADIISNLHIEVDGDTVHDLTKRQNEAELTRMGFYATGFETGGYDYHTDRNDDPLSAMDLNKAMSLKVTPTFDAANGTGLTVFSSYWGKED